MSSRISFLIAQSLSPSAPAKEYIYVNGRIVAIENGASSSVTGTISANPNPTIVTDGTGLGITTLYYSATGTASTQVWVNNSSVVCYGSASGTCTTGKWVTNGMTFQLKDTNTGSTLATTTVTVQSQSPTPVGAGVYDDRDSHLIYSGTWSQNNETDLYATTQSFSNQPSNSVSLTFTGTTVAYVYAMCYNIGKTEVRIDGSLVDTIDGYLYGPISNPNFNWQKIAVYSGLSAGNHTITVTATSQKNASATDNYTTIDAFIVGQIYNDSASGFTYYAGWSTSVGYPVFWGGDQHYTDTPGYYVSRNFTGSSATVIFTYAPNAGIAQVTVDGVVVGTIDQYGPNVNSTDPTYFRISRTYSGFSSGTHQLKVTCTGNYNPLSTYLGINIDAVITPQ